MCQEEQGYTTRGHCTQESASGEKDGRPLPAAAWRSRRALPNSRTGANPSWFRLPQVREQAKPVISVAGNQNVLLGVWKD